jgi:hypothetical protein
MLRVTRIFGQVSTDRRPSRTLISVCVVSSLTWAETHSRIDLRMGQFKLWWQEITDLGFDRQFPARLRSKEAPYERSFRFRSQLSTDWAWRTHEGRQLILACHYRLLRERSTAVTGMSEIVAPPLCFRQRCQALVFKRSQLDQFGREADEHLSRSESWQCCFLV